jgi:CTP:molybdopterin cytidylyltransferase MocA
MSNLGIVVLAAGGSTRMGSPKQLLEYEGVSLLRRAVTVAAETPFRPLVVVLGAEWERCRRELADLPVTVIVNPQWQKGIGSSLRRGVGLLDAHLPEVDGALIMLQDQPLITSAMLISLAQAWRPPTVPIAAALYGNTLGVPAIFDRSLFPELLDLENEEGAKKVIARHKSLTGLVSMPEAMTDMDTPDDYKKLTGPAGTLRGAAEPVPVKTVRELADVREDIVGAS